MDSSTLIAVLSFGTLGSVIAFALISKRRTDARRNDPTAPKSTLAKDGPDGGTQLLDPGPGVTPTPVAMTPQDGHATR